MRTITADQQGVIDSGVQSEWVRVSVKDSGGTFRDLTTYPGFNAVKQVQWKEDVEGPHMTADITLTREFYDLSLNPFISASALNKAFNPAGSYAALIALNREVLIETAIVAMDRQPSGGDWMEVFRGRIDTFDPASGWDIRIACRGLAGRLAQQYIKRELVYSFVEVGGVAKAAMVWTPGVTVPVGWYMIPATRGTNDSGNNKFFVSSQAGVTGSVEPLWGTGTAIPDDADGGTLEWDYVGAPTTSGNPVEEIIQNILDDHKGSGDPTVTLYVPSSPGWAIRQFLQQRTYTLDAVLALANQIGWDIRYKWRSGTSQFEFTLYVPNRSSPSVDKTFTSSEYERPTRLSVDIANIRNAWRVIYSDRADLLPDGTPKRKVIEVSDSSSITKYGELWAEIQEDSNSQIDSSTEATTLANAALSDCKEPTAEMSVTLRRGFPWTEINDYYTFGFNDLTFDSSQSLAVTGWSQSYDAGKKKLTTQLQLRGTPTIGAGRWVGRTNHPALAQTIEPHRITHFNGPDTAAATLRSEVGGFSATMASTLDKQRLVDDEIELHVSTTDGFTPSSSTLKAVTRGGSGVAKSVGDLVPRKTHYVRTVQRFYNNGRIVRGQPSAQQSIVSGQAKAGHYDSGSTQSHLPLNGNFEHASDDLTLAPPDQWQVVTRPSESTEEWGSSGSVYYGEDFTTKGRYIELRAHTSKRGNIMSTPFVVRRGARAINLYLSIMRTGSSAASGKDLIVDVEGYADAAMANQTINYSFFLSGDSAGPFPSLNTWYNHAIDVAATTGALGSSTNFIRLGLRRGTTGDTSFAWRVGDVYFQEADFKQLVADAATITQETWKSVSFSNSFQDYDTANFQPTAYFKDSQGVVHLRGLVKRASAALSTTIFTLDSGYRPAKSTNLWVVANNRGARVEILSTGTVQVVAADDASWFNFFSLDGITFDTR